MRYIERAIEQKIKRYIQPNKVTMLIGARRVGKTELIKHILPDLDEKPLVLHGEDAKTLDALKERSTSNYIRILGNTKLLIIDEAQAIPDIGAKLKLMVDTIEDIKIIVTGSSVFDLDKLGEPLVGRKITFHLYPLSQLEFVKNENYTETLNKLEERLVLGSYPELGQVDQWNEKILYLEELLNSYLLRDILAYEGIRRREVIISLLRKLAFRSGSEISLEGLGNDLQISKNTVDKYLDLLSKVFIIHKVTGFSRNLDNEITKKNKWYFYDNGIRNALISNFNRLDVRNDQGILWENYLISERLKYQSYAGLPVNNYFWRTHSKQEIDWIEEREGKLYGYEFKWENKKNSINAPVSWVKAYPEAEFEVINPNNYLDFIT